MASEKTGTAAERETAGRYEETGEGERLLPAQPRGEREGLQTVSSFELLQRGRHNGKTNAKVCVIFLL